MVKIKIFKKFRKFQENFLSSSKLTYYISTKYYKKKWNIFIKPVDSSQKTSDFIKISNFYKKNLIFKHKTKLIKITTNSDLFLATALVETKFCKSYQEAYFIINKGFIFVNKKKTTNKIFKLHPGDIVIIKPFFGKQNWFTSYFFTKFKQTTTNFKFDSKYEISFSNFFFIVCFLG